MTPPSDIDVLASAVQQMSRDDLIGALRDNRCPFPIDFTDDFLATCALERLKNYVLGLEMYASRNLVAARPA